MSKYKIVTVLFLLVFSTHTGLTSSRAVAAQNKWIPWIEFGGFAGKGNAYRGEAIIFTPIWQTEFGLAFAELQGKLFNQNIQEGNFAIGYRQMLDKNWNFGGWLGLDVRSSQTGNLHWQAAAGIELLHPDWDLRVNGYAPLSPRKKVSSSTSTSTAISTTATTTTAGAAGSPTVALVGNQILLTSGGLSTITTSTVTRTTTISTATTVFEQALWGADVEIGMRIPLEMFGRQFDAKKHELRFYGGGFYFDSADIAQAVAGPKARIEWRINDILPDVPGSRLTFEAGYSYDKVRNHNWEIGFRLRIPIGAQRDATRYAALTPQEMRMTEGLRRDTDIVTGEESSLSGSTSSTTSTVTSTKTTGSPATTEAVEDAATNVSLDRVAAVDGTGNLQTTINTAGANSLIIAQGGAGNINGAVVLQNSQTLIGGGATMQVRGKISGALATFSAPGSQPTVKNTANSAVVTIANNTHVVGLNVQGAGNTSGLNSNFGIAGNGRSNVVIENNRVTNLGHNGMFFDSNNRDFIVRGNLIQNTGGNGIRFENNNINIKIESNSVLDWFNRFNGINLASNNTNIEITSNIAIGPGGAAVALRYDNDDVLIEKNTLKGDRTTGMGVAMAGRNNNIRILGNTIADTGPALGQGKILQIFSDNTNIVFSNNSVSEIASNAFTLINRNNLEISQNTFSGAFGENLLLVSGSNNVLSGAGNINNAVVAGRLCDAPSATAFTGTVGFNGGPSLQDNVLPCN